MTSRVRPPAWWQIDLVGIGMLGLLLFWAGLPLSEHQHEAAALGTLALGFVLIDLWLQANLRALLNSGSMDQARRARLCEWDSSDARHTAIRISRLEPEETSAPTDPGHIQGAI